MDIDVLHETHLDITEEKELLRRRLEAERDFYSSKYRQAELIETANLSHRVLNLARKFETHSRDILNSSADIECEYGGNKVGYSEKMRQDDDDDYYYDDDGYHTLLLKGSSRRKGHQATHNSNNDINTTMNTIHSLNLSVDQNQKNVATGTRVGTSWDTILGHCVYDEDVDLNTSSCHSKPNVAISIKQSVNDTRPNTSITKPNVTTKPIFTNWNRNAVVDITTDTKTNAARSVATKKKNPVPVIKSRRKPKSRDAECNPEQIVRAPVTNEEQAFNRIRQDRSSASNNNDGSINRTGSINKGSSNSRGGYAGKGAKIHSKSHDTSVQNSSSQHSLGKPQKKLSHHDATKTLLNQAIENSDFALLNIILRMSPQQVKTFFNTDKDGDGNNLIHRCCQNGNHRLATILVELGDVDINVAGEKMRTPLHVASHANDASIVQLLLNSCADLYRRDDGGRRPVDLCTDPKVKMMLLRRMSTRSRSFNHKKSSNGYGRGEGCGRPRKFYDESKLTRIDSGFVNDSDYNYATQNSLVLSRKAFKLCKETVI
eukprot:gene4788-5415_t